MKKKGFTLIELLAVIVLLAIITIIAVPKILNVIEKSKESSAESSIKLVKDAIKTQIVSGDALNESNFIKNNDGCYLSFKIGILNLKKVILNGFCFNLLGGNINSYVNSNNNLVLNFGYNFNLLFVFVFYTIIIFYIIKYNIILSYLYIKVKLFSIFCNDNLHHELFDYQSTSFCCFF